MMMKNFMRIFHPPIWSRCTTSSYSCIVTSATYSAELVLPELQVASSVGLVHVLLDVGGNMKMSRQPQQNHLSSTSPTRSLSRFAQSVIQVSSEGKRSRVTSLRRCVACARACASTCSSQTVRSCPKRNQDYDVRLLAYIGHEKASMQICRPNPRSLPPLPQA